jgi:uncharacterized membrane protein
MTGFWQTLRVAAVMAVGAVYLGLGYIAASSDNPPLVSLLVGLLPLAALALTVAWQSSARLVAVPLSVAALIWAVWNLQLLRGHVASFYFVQHVGAMVMLGLMFGSTLWGGHDKALCSRIAAMVMPEALEPDYMRYTWQVTWVWTLFFVISGCLSVGLFFWGPLEWWALFANVLTPVLVGALFVAEYIVRIRILPNRPHLSIAGTVQAYQRFRNSVK